MIESSNRLEGIGTYYFADKLAQIRKMNASGENVINLGIGSPDLPAPKVAMDRLKEVLAHPDVSTYQAYRSRPELRKAFANWYETHFEFKLDPEHEVLPLMGSKEGIMHISMSFLSSGDKVLVPDPGYPAYATAAKLAGAEVIHYDLTESGDWRPDISSLEKMDLSAVKLMWVSYPHMPTGAKGDINLFADLVSFTKKHNILLCHDNPYAFILNDTPLSVLNIEGALDSTLELTSLSKCYNMAGWRIGCLAGRKEYIDTVLKFKSNMDSGMFKGIQEAAIVALGEGDSWFSELNEEYVKRRDYAFAIMDCLECKYRTDMAGMFIWARIPDSIESAELYAEEILEKAKVFITPGMVFGKNGHRYLRISLCSNIELFTEAHRRIQETFRRNFV
jgi:aspartate/methionine/tyrosine aminotransferase